MIQSYRLTVGRSKGFCFSYCTSMILLCQIWDCRHPHNVTFRRDQTIDHRRVGEVQCVFHVYQRATGEAGLRPPSISASSRAPPRVTCNGTMMRFAEQQVARRTMARRWVTSRFELPDTGPTTCVLEPEYLNVWSTDGRMCEPRTHQLLSFLSPSKPCCQDEVSVDCPALLGHTRVWLGVASGS